MKIFNMVLQRIILVWYIFTHSNYAAFVSCCSQMLYYNVSVNVCCEDMNTSLNYKMFTLKHLSFQSIIWFKESNCLKKASNTHLFLTVKILVKVILIFQVW